MCAFQFSRIPKMQMKKELIHNVNYLRRRYTDSIRFCFYSYTQTNSLTPRSSSSNVASYSAEYVISEETASELEWPSEALSVDAEPGTVIFNG